MKHGESFQKHTHTQTPMKHGTRAPQQCSESVHIVQSCKPLMTRECKVCKHDKPEPSVHWLGHDPHPCGELSMFVQKHFPSLEYEVRPCVVSIRTVASSRKVVAWITNWRDRCLQWKYANSRSVSPSRPLPPPARMLECATPQQFWTGRWEPLPCPRWIVSARWWNKVTWFLRNSIEWYPTHLVIEVVIQKTRLPECFRKPWSKT